jgi:hypothetical protein
MPVPQYTFEDPAAFLADFGVEVSMALTYGWTFDRSNVFTLDSVGAANTLDGGVPGVITVKGILSQPGEDIMGNRIASNQYELEYETSSLDLAFGVSLTVTFQSGAVQDFTVLQTYMVDDGVFSRVRLQT